MTIDREPPIAVFLFADPTVDAVRQSPTQRHSLCHSDEVRGSEFKKYAARGYADNISKNENYKKEILSKAADYYGLTRFSADHIRVRAQGK